MINGVCQAPLLVKGLRYDGQDRMNGCDFWGVGDNFVLMMIVRMRCLGVARKIYHFSLRPS